MSYDRKSNKQTDKQRVLLMYVMYNIQKCPKRNKMNTGIVNKICNIFKYIRKKSRKYVQVPHDLNPAALNFFWQP